MEERKKETYKLFDQPDALFQAMLEDINKAKEYIFLETYKFGNDSVGNKFRNALTAKAKQGVTIKLLIDSWGSGVPLSFFSEMIRYGAEVRYFQKIVLAFDFFTKNHRRNHRKIMIIDDKITYIGSANLTGYSMKWRELQLRVANEIATCFKKAFLASFADYRKYIINKFNYRKTIYCNNYEIIQDIPSIYRQRIKRRYEKLIQRAKKEIIIETPYFIPGFKLRKALMDAATRGVDVQIIMPQHSDVRIVDLLRNNYLGLLYRSKVKILFYTPTNLHAKAALFDNETFVIGSANFDYRSFRYLHEIQLLGKEKAIIHLLRKHLDETIRHCIPFNYAVWIKRPVIEKIFSQLLIPFRHLF